MVRRPPPPELKRPPFNLVPGGWGTFIQIILGLGFGIPGALAFIEPGLDPTATKWLHSNAGLLLLGAFVASLIGVPVAVWSIELVPIMFKRLQLYPRLARDYADLQSAMDATRGVAELDDSLLRLLAQLTEASDKAKVMEKLLTEFLRDVTGIFNGEVSRASILRPNPNSPNYLERWSYTGMPADTTRETPFYIGPYDPTKKRGTAGQAFVTRRLRIVHMEEQDDHWQPVVFVVNDEGALVRDIEQDYIDSAVRRPFAPYRSFICIPIDQGPNLPPLGILCFDSMNIHVFDAVNQHNALILLGRRISAAARIYSTLT